MAVYVDRARHRYGRMILCHMLADSVGELLKMADEIGVARRWFQCGSHPHFDICQSKRALAIACGAIEIGPHDVVRVMRMYRTNLTPEEITAVQIAAKNSASPVKTAISPTR